MTTTTSKRRQRLCLIPALLAACVSAQGTAPKLNYYLKGAAPEETTPFVTIDNILPPALLEAVRNEIYNGVGDHKPSDCKFLRDEPTGLDCGEEHWLDFTLQDALGQQRQGEHMGIRDILEQAVAEIARQDLIHVLPHHVSRSIAGVSWRVLVRESGTNEHDYHYDSDEGWDNVLEDVPLVNPLLSTVTYLSNHGEPTVVLEQAQIINGHNNNVSSFEDSDFLYPPAAYVVMPAANKHLAFDPRLVHGSYNSIAKYPQEDEPTERRWRMVIGTNYHTQHSLETPQDDSLEAENLTPPLGDEELVRDDNDKPTIHPWNAHTDLTTLEKRHERFPDEESWQVIDVPLVGSGFDYCQHLAPCLATIRLPVAQMLHEEYNIHNGTTFGFELRRSKDQYGQRADFVVQPDPSSEAKDEVYWQRSELHSPPPSKRIEDVKQMLRARCDMFPHNVLSMNPPLNHKLCESEALLATSDARSGVGTIRGQQQQQLTFDSGDDL